MKAWIVALACVILAFAKVTDGVLRKRRQLVVLAGNNDVNEGRTSGRFVSEPFQTEKETDQLIERTLYYDVNSHRECRDNSKCKSLGLTGMCCPTRCELLFCSTSHSLLSFSLLDKFSLNPRLSCYSSISVTA